jgi:outer membrane protein assembly factor BamE (lipoprotein component of BamABCDE complex)
MTLKSILYKLSLFAVVSLSGCEVIDVRGHEIDFEQLKKVKVGATTKEQVTEFFGTPSAVSTFNNKTWFYMSERTSTRAFFSPLVLASNITRIEFDDTGRVKVIDSLTEANKVVIAHVHRSTPTAGYEFGVLEQIFGNVGRFNGKDPDMGNRRGP